MKMRGSHPTILLYHVCNLLQESIEKGSDHVFHCSADYAGQKTTKAKCEVGIAGKTRL